MKTYLIAAFITFGAALGALSMTNTEADATPKVPFTQADFPCEEDEVLGYAPEFGTDSVGCIHIDVLKAR
ncbi:hypothetical protein FGG22_gp027 [Mycobacterium phage Hammer]|uniref:Uncharacterized protein n=4 Tax=Gladiatorvirus TaxID=2948726 RepID=A0A1C9LYY6_9CAUD|nr:hypothetical protein X820_gp026 [Mycobacterium phage CloudWang3]YP_008858512.1 hypothetical protein X828_gp026 [Mycobacterium phage Artemis2UCLA]YP_009635579.1 hypothetical protein FGG54_gp23 [Mycobacterium phage Gladiator]YP_009636604.1 hypothetical protein FGG22_gp027 [Mycobacterium phage Hammer]ANT42288.1 hypothetical protein SEA_TONETONE_86 [Mycobacterium phage ToneTone]AOQ28102.1 hypothetical protein SEA_GRUUNAGA_88 [Mycobacterium phage Gruunaga]QAY14254.1 hypothetical protein SEA_HEX